MSKTGDVSHILQVAFAFWSSKVLLTAVEMDLFSKLVGRSLNCDELAVKSENVREEENRPVHE
jgi:hypothetical protein